MDGIIIEVTGNIARVIEKPLRITSGTVGLPVEFTFDSQWDGLIKSYVFQAGHICKSVINPESEITTVPWEVLAKPGPCLSIGVYGVNADGSVAIPTVWANVSVIRLGARPECDPSADPTKPAWLKLRDDVDRINEVIDEMCDEIANKLRVTTISLPSSRWVGSDNLHSQVVSIAGVTPYSKVDLLPSVEQLAIFHDKDVAFVTENEDGVVTVYAIGDKPTQDYTMQAQITEVIA